MSVKFLETYIQKINVSAICPHFSMQLFYGITIAKISEFSRKAFIGGLLCIKTCKKAPSLPSRHSLTQSQRWKHYLKCHILVQSSNEDSKMASKQLFFVVNTCQISMIKIFFAITINVPQPPQTPMVIYKKWSS